MAKKAMGRIDQLEAAANIAKKLPRHPGQDHVEAAIRSAVQPWATKATTTIVMRLVGYWHFQNAVGGRTHIIERGWMSRTAAYRTEADFRRVFGCEPEEWDPSKLQAFLLGDAAEAPASSKA